MRYIIAILCIALSVTGFAQTSQPDVADTMQNTFNSVASIPDKSLDYIEKKYTRLSETIQKQNEKVLQRMQEKEAKIRKKLALTDSLKAAELFGQSAAKYQSIKDKLQRKLRLREYIPGLDTVATSLQFLSQTGTSLDANAAKLSDLSNSVDDLQSRLQQATEIQSFVRQREKELKEQLMNTGLAKELLSINKEAYYYQQRLAEYKELLNDRKKLEQRLITEVQKLPLFQRFIQKHGYLALLFPTPENFNTNEALNGLQTRVTTQNLITQRIGSSMPSSQDYFLEQSQIAQNGFNLLKNKLDKATENSYNSEMTIPDFQPNQQKTKSLLQRLEYGINVQSSRNNKLLPSISDIAGTIGYKINDKSTIGFGMTYKLGLGNSWDSIKFTHQGIGIRSYLDIKVKGQWWISGGMEYNYMYQFSKMSDLVNNDIWQKSALCGITKKLPLRGSKSAKIQLLFDFLAHKYQPATSQLKFRIGYSF